MKKSTLAGRVLAELERLYPRAVPHLEHNSPWELLVATVLSAQCTDARVNQVTPGLFRRLPSPLAFAEADQEELEELIRSTGFYRNKARHLIAAARKLVENFNGEVPRNMADLLTLDGVARKTANIVLSGAFGLNEGLAVDTHVARISARLGLTSSSSPQAIERDLLPLFPRPEWGRVNHRMVSFGRDICKARSPRCRICPLADICPGREKAEGAPSRRLAGAGS
ncbi:MAG: endonuclease III [Deltaproteobacteria bacterium]|jgi:endonuclease-3|nr:endonuclease III [Deltaproteobacteria bacterium]